LSGSRLAPHFFFAFGRFLIPLSSTFLTAVDRSWRAELGQYDCLAQLSTELNWYRGQYDALVEALRTDNSWLEYRLRAVRDALLDQGAQTVEGGSAVDMVKVALLERDEARCRRCARL
jgi:hypothetical protein